MTSDALRRQENIVFGCLADGLTADVEPGEAQFFSWREDAENKEENVYHFWVWLGIRQRGSIGKFWLKERGICSSVGEGRIPQLTD
eukprot:8198399-Karenia_brevis.AAC.1